MIQVTTVQEARAAAHEARIASPQQRLGFVPTMGYLHEGHLALVRRAKAENGCVAVSVFVNPTQFGPTEDLATYPRNLEHDLELLREAGADIVFTPSVSEMYPDGHSTFVDVMSMTDLLEGRDRPGHFVGVATVVTMLLNAVNPSHAYFGRKDAQQCAVIQRLVIDLLFPTEIVLCDTIRDADGLALSSRNAYLSDEDRAAATVLNRALQSALELYRSGECDGPTLRSHITDMIASEPRARIDYVSVAHPTQLTELARIDPEVGALASVAVHFGSTRLIDNVAFEGPSHEDSHTHDEPVGASC